MKHTLCLLALVAQLYYPKAVATGTVFTGAATHGNAITQEINFSAFEFYDRLSFMIPVYKFPAANKAAPVAASSRQSDMVTGCPKARL